MKTVLCWIVLAAAVVPARAELTPNQVAVIAMAESPESKELAAHYMKARNIPETQILLLEGKPVDTMSRQTWETQIRPAIRKWLSEGGRDEKIRCLVTCWDVPLKIDRRAADSPVVVERTKYLAGARSARVAQMDKLLGELDALGREKPPAAPEPIAADASLQAIASRFDAAMKDTRERLGKITAEDEKQKASATFDRVFVGVGGNVGILRIMAARSKAEALGQEQTAQLAAVNARLQGIAQGIQALDALPDTVSRDAQILGLVQFTEGLLGGIRWIDQQKDALEKNETYSSFDSELSLVHWPDYPLFRWQPNLLYYGYKVSDGQSVLMVSRLAAPTLDLAKKLVDKAVATEATGLAGKVYLDARGMTYDAEKSQPGSYEAYDQSLRDLAERLKQHTTLTVVLNNEPELFQPGACPDAALYCGWYSLAKYVDAFDWNPGAVGYHLASAEATTLRTPGNQAWCNAILEDGITATLGPVYEPYLPSFPKPDDFFPLLLTGKYTLVEAYYRTKPFDSWVMVLVGDPLYNPFKKKPALDEAGLPERLR